MGFYDLKARDIDGKIIEISNYKGKTLLIVNTATKCGLAPQLKDLEELYKKYKNSGVEVLGFPCGQFANQEEDDNKEIQNVCQINYGVTFKMFEKINVNGKETHLLFKYLKNEAKGMFSKEIKWNFTKFLVDKDGNVIKRYAPTKKIVKIEEDIKKLIL